METSDLKCWACDARVSRSPLRKDTRSSSPIFQPVAQRGRALLLIIHMRHGQFRSLAQANDAADVFRAGTPVALGMSAVH